MSLTLIFATAAYSIETNDRDEYDAGQEWEAVDRMLCSKWTGIGWSAAIDVTIS